MQTDSTIEQTAQGDSTLRKICAGAALLAFAPFLWTLALRLFSATHYWFFPLYLGGLFWVTWPRYRDAFELKPLTLADALRFGIPIIALTMAVKFNSPLFAGIAILFALRAIMKSMASQAWHKGGLRGAWLALWLCLPLPFGLDQYLIQKLQHLASAGASRVLDWLEMPHLLTGVLIQFPGRTFEIEEACSGIESIYAALAATWLFCVFHKYRFSRTFVLLITCIFWVLVANIFRITFVAICEIKWSIAAGSGWRHEGIGLLCFMAALLMVACSERMLRFFLPPLMKYDATQSRRKTVVAMAGLQRIVPTRILFATIATILFLLSGWHWTSRAVSASAPSRPPETSVTADSASMPEEFDGWRRTGFEDVERDYRDINGQRSWIWTFQRNGIEVQASLDGPFRRWHNLGWCYESQGWHVRLSRDVNLTINRKKVEATEIEMENADGEEAYVLFAALDEMGDPTPPASLYRFGVGMRFPATTNKLRSLWRKMNGRSSVREPKVVHQVQVFAKLPVAANQPEKKQLKNLFRQVFSTASATLFQESREDLAADSGD